MIFRYYMHSDTLSIYIYTICIPYVCHVVECVGRFEQAQYDACSTDQTFLQDFQVILKLMVQNYLKSSRSISSLLKVEGVITVWKLSDEFLVSKGLMWFISLFTHTRAILWMNEFMIFYPSLFIHNCVNTQR